jgi:hypothetical protein
VSSRKILGGVTALVAGSIIFSGAISAQPAITTLNPGDNFFACPGGQNWNVSPATSMGTGVFDANCPPASTTTTTVLPTTTTVAPTTTTTVAPTTTTIPTTTTSPTTIPPTTTTTIPPTTTTIPPPPALWKPPRLFEWQWLLTGTLNTNNATQMGTGITAWDGTKPPATNPTVYDIDAILNPASTVRTLHNMGFKAICYIEVGTVGNYYTASQEGIPVTYYQQFVNAGVVGNKLPGYNEWFLNINSPATSRILESMISQQCVSKGFDAVETDLDVTYDNKEGRTGFTITQRNEETFLSNLALYMNRNGEVWFSKNLAHSVSNSFVSAMEPYAAGDLDEETQEFKTIGYLKPFMTAKKPILDVEFALAQSKYCASDIAMGVVGTKFNVALNGPRVPCDL